MLHPVIAPRLLALSAAATLLVPGMALAGRPGTTVTPVNTTTEYSSPVSEVDACNQAQYRMPPSAIVKAMRVSTAISGEYATFTCRVKWSLTPTTPPTYRPILFSPSA
ncbi:hypothetical protein [Cyanobium sp. FACHB-13342]|uniref:hypothetical protein n=1 Tax=Cyanobium sp. FACHB-13342 TaxID=2692793 RepID=UPI00167FE385|nr:hypothetical protein [Cyanobium sp. FACHB-13342]MBD2422048.1 hypothetical protein [Cyanobium sp. FACHB-13342]